MEIRILRLLLVLHCNNIYLQQSFSFTSRFRILKASNKHQKPNILLKARMRILTLSYALAALQMGTAHTVFTTLFINDANQSPGTCVRMPMTPNKATFPINDLKSDNMACGTSNSNTLT